MEMNRSVRLFSVRLAAALLLVGQVAPAQDAGSGKLPLWKVTGENSTAYLFGSIHFAREDMYPLDPAVTTAFDESDTLVVEIDIAKIDPTEMQQLMMSEGTYGAGESLSAQLSEDELSRLKSFIAERSFPFPLFDRFRPWLAAMMVTILEVQRLGFKTDLGIDMHFLKRAHEIEKPIYALESVDFQIRLLSGFSDEMHRLFLTQTIEQMAEIPKMVDELVAVWKSGDADALDRLLVQPQKNDERMVPLFEKLLRDRNFTMTDKIRELMTSGGTWFVVVGAGHIIGKDGLVDLFERDENFSVTQLSAQAAVSR
jgi:uncharacterized protein YbaP (TraB family)